METATPVPTLARTERRDAWWRPPLVTGLGLVVLGSYALFAAIQGAHFRYEEQGAQYLSPFYSPDVERLFGVNLPFSFAFVVLWAPLGLRATCYYYRKAYYRSLFLRPPACAVAGRGSSYRGESKLPFVLQNAHRYFLYFATIVLGFIWYDTGRAFVFHTGDGSLEFGVGLGSLVLLANALALSFFTFGCNSLRHLAGGKLDCFSCSASARARYHVWRGIKIFNLRHMEWAWISLCLVVFADLYVRLLAYGVFGDPRII